MVGHIPHDVSLSQAIGAGQVTLEHLKGYYQDRDLAMTTDPWAELTGESDVWNCPTLSTVFESARGTEAGKRMRTRAAQLLGPEILGLWEGEATESEDRVRGVILERSQLIISELSDVTDRWLAGTDSGGGGRFLVPGEVLHEEIDLMESAGISREQVLHSATHAIAPVHPQAGFPASVSVGQPADFLVVESDPRLNPAVLRTPAGVMSGGRWFDRRSLNGITSSLVAANRTTHDPDSLVGKLQDDAEAVRNDWHRSMTAYVLEELGGDPSVVPPWRHPVPDL